LVPVHIAPQKPKTPCTFRCKTLSLREYSKFKYQK